MAEDFKMNYLSGWFINYTPNTSITLALSYVNGYYVIGLEHEFEDEDRVERITLPVAEWEVMMKKATPELLEKAQRIKAESKSIPENSPPVNDFRMNCLSGRYIKFYPNERIALGLSYLNGDYVIGLEHEIEDEHRVETIFMPLADWELMMKKATPDLLETARRLQAESKSSLAMTTPPVGTNSSS